ncbi:hypothetical protein F183_A38530 [Bryobacterales bacterium F-183]|nr:hypothetical protein F183_A38530 [Bryobacterales bacterium F-183]
MKLFLISSGAFLAMCYGAWTVRTATTPGWLLMAAAIFGLLVIFRMPRSTRAASQVQIIGQDVTTMQLKTDLAEGSLRFREGRYHEALMSLERCFLNAFAINDAEHGGESGLLLLKTLVALGRYEDTRAFAMGVRELSNSPEIEDLVAIAENRLVSAA